MLVSHYLYAADVGQKRVGNDAKTGFSHGKPSAKPSIGRVLKFTAQQVVPAAFIARV